MFDLGAALATLIVLTTFWLLQAIAAFSNNMLTVRQMRTIGVKRGMPYLHHHGMWNDLLVVHPLLALYVGENWKEWQQLWWVLVPLAAVCVYCAWKQCHAWAQNPDVIESHTEIAEDKIHSTGHMSLVGWIHVPHMALILVGFGMILVQILRGTVPTPLLFGTICLINGHIAIGQHAYLRIFNPEWNPWPSSGLGLLYMAAHVGFTIGGFWLIFRFLLE